MKRILCRFFIMVLAASLIGGAVFAEASLYERGLEISAMMSEMAQNEAYLSAFTANPDVLNRLAHAAAEDPHSPKAAYRITISSGMLSDFLYENADEIHSEALRTALENKTWAAMAGQINAAGGAECLAASTLCTASLSFFSGDFEQNGLYLYLYENAAPALVSMTSDSDGIVTASGSLILFDGFAPNSESEAASFFEGLPITVSQIDPQ